jgi:hypothetical protein
MKDYMDDYEDFDFEDTEEDLLENWITCEYDEDDPRYENCADCGNYEECLENAEDNRAGYELFCDIVSDAYGSVDAFWECNGI